MIHEGVDQCTEQDNSTTTPVHLAAAVDRLDADQKDSNLTRLVSMNSTIGSDAQVVCSTR